MDYDVVEAGVDDAEAITDVTLRSLEASYNEPSHPDRERVLRRWQAYIRKEHHPQKAKEPRVIYAALADGEMVGYIAGHLTERFGMDGELQSIYILKEHQRRGLGTRLVIELARWFQPWNATKVCVDAVRRSRGFYLKLGARPFRGPWMVWDNFLDVLDQRRRDTATSFTIREATPTDIPALAELHVKTWNATYPKVRKKPTYEIRERQWREAFAVTDGSWFCFVVEDQSGALVGFAKGTPYNHSDLPDFAGELSKIYLLREYQQQGLGRRLVGHVARRFFSQGVSSIVLFADPDNPSCRFYEALGAERLLDAAGNFHGGYGWRDLRRLAAICPTE